MQAVMLLLHVTLAIFIIGGATAIGFLILAYTTKPREEALPVLRVAEKMEKVMGPASVLVPLIGLGMVGASNEVYKFSQTWVWLSIVLYVVYAVLGAVVAARAVRAMVTALEAAPAGSTAATAVPAVVQQYRLTMVAFVVILLVIVAMMVWRPGATFNINDYLGG